MKRTKLCQKLRFFWGGGGLAVSTVMKLENSPVLSGIRLESYSTSLCWAFSETFVPSLLILFMTKNYQSLKSKRYNDKQSDKQSDSTTVRPLDCKMVQKLAMLCGDSRQKGLRLTKAKLSIWRPRRVIEEILLK